MVRREERISSIVSKTGRQGDFFLVELEAAIHDSSGRLAVRDLRSLIYRDGSSSPGLVPDLQALTRPPPPALLLRTGARWTFENDPSALVRFSSASSNGHRIHYDYPYATQVEGYPGLVVHGPLMSLSLAQVVRHEFPAEDVAWITHRNLRPLFCGERAEVEMVEDSAGTVGLRLVRDSVAQVCLEVRHSSRP